LLIKEAVERHSSEQGFCNKLWEATALVFGTGFGFGYSPVAPGTVGSLLGLFVVWTWQQVQLPSAVNGLAIAATVLAGIPICSRAARLFDVEDPSHVVFDEIAAFPIVFLAIPFDWTSGFIGFCWFRLFDVIKPWPVHRLENLPGGIGIMADDLAAAVYAAVSLWLTVKLFEM